MSTVPCAVCGQSGGPFLTASVDLDDEQVARYRAKIDQLRAAAQARYEKERAPVPTIGAWVDGNVPEAARAEVTAALRRLLGRDDLVLRAWLIDRTRR